MPNLLFWLRKRPPPQTACPNGEAPARAELLERVAQLESELAFYRERHDHVTSAAADAGQENAVLRYKTSKLMQDNQVLEWHVSGSRRELEMALRLLRRAEQELKRRTDADRADADAIHALPQLLIGLERTVIRALSWLRAEEHGVTFQMHSGRDPGPLREELQKLHQAIDSIARALGLEPATLDTHRLIAAELGIWWAHLEDLKSQQLRQHGTVAAGVLAGLDPSIETLITHIADTLRMAGRTDAEVV